MKLSESMFTEEEWKEIRQEYEAEQIGQSTATMLKCPDCGRYLLVDETQFFLSDGKEIKITKKEHLA